MFYELWKQTSSAGFFTALWTLNSLNYLQTTFKQKFLKFRFKTSCRLFEQRYNLLYYNFIKTSCLETKKIIYRFPTAECMSYHEVFIWSSADGAGDWITRYLTAPSAGQWRGGGGPRCRVASQCKLEADATGSRYTFKRFRGVLVPALWTRSRLVPDSCPTPLRASSSAGLGFPAQRGSGGGEREPDPARAITRGVKTRCSRFPWARCLQSEGRSGVTSSRILRGRTTKQSSGTSITRRMISRVPLWVGHFGDSKACNLDLMWLKVNVF